MERQTERLKDRQTKIKMTDTLITRTLNNQFSGTAIWYMYIPYVDQEFTYE